MERKPVLKITLGRKCSLLGSAAVMYTWGLAHLNEENNKDIFVQSD